MKQINKSNAKSLMLAFTVGAMTLAQLTACSTADEVTGNNGNETASLKLIIDGTLPTDNSKSRSGSLVDNDTHTGGMDFKWLASTDKMTAVAYGGNRSLLSWVGSTEQSCMVAVTPDVDNRYKATLTPTANVSNYIGDPKANGMLYCVQNIKDKVVETNLSMSGNLTMPPSNLFIQTEKNSTSHLTNYLFMMGNSLIKTQMIKNEEMSVADVDVSFHPAVATIRLKVTNQRSEPVVIKNINIKSSDDRMMLFPNTKIWRCRHGDTEPWVYYVGGARVDPENYSSFICPNCKGFVQTSKQVLVTSTSIVCMHCAKSLEITCQKEQISRDATVTEPTDQASYYNTITAQCGTSGFEVASGEALYNYVAVHQHDATDALTDKSLDFVITTADGSTYTAYNFDCNKLSEITGNKDFVAGYTYTFTLSLKDKLTFGGVTVFTPTGSSTDLPGWNDETDIQ